MLGDSHWQEHLGGSIVSEVMVTVDGAYRNDFSVGFSELLYARRGLSNAPGIKAAE
jgi:hypothetical protein